MTTTTLSPTALKGFSDAASYDIHRPSYIPRAVNSFLALLNLAFRNKSKILEIGAGTGKFTEILSTRDEEYEVVAVEPHGEMRAIMEGKKLRGVKTLDGTAEGVELKVGKAWADAVIVAQAFHWFATLESLKSIYTALKPHGRLGLIWNIEDYNQTRGFKCHTKWEEALKAAAWEHDDGEPRVRNDLWRKVFENPEGQKLFGKLEEREFPVSIWIEKEDLWKRINTMSYISNLSDEKKQEFRRKFDNIVDNGSDVERDASGKIHYHYTVITAVTQRK
ncbi:S-adenosyl-L-methionine-dependent methyltransferase [Ascobolus immersus RN42]|uniref:S-adenosyl-L-methionine-dependent methyltransferase n=1 Tax=Ascobolus immersus RN42 TaxID=1160509 RepID=A0A3N4IP35_ASCIM|nr:S-adenosyl-L-methionine-dependent methyltransferase [Ascobolus immersus RN42]